MIRQGLFGPIQVLEREGTRALLLNAQVQGACFLSPSAKDVGVEADGPGPIASSPYVAGWLLAGVHQPYGSGLMVGLGSGAGAVHLLHNFPHIDLTVVEIDPVMAEVALRSFPMLEHYLNTGRLDIVLADANEYLKRNDRFDFGFADAYDGGESFELISGYLSRLCQVCNDVFINAIDSPDLSHIHKLVQTCHAAGNPLVCMMKAVAPDHQHLSLPKANYILTSAELDPFAVDSFTPFANVVHPSAEYAQACWNLMISTTMEIQS